MKDALVWAYLNSDRRPQPPEVQRAHDEVEEGLRRVYSAMQAIDEGWRTVLFSFYDVTLLWGENRNFDDYCKSVELWEPIVRRMVEKCADRSGKSPHVPPRSGRRGRRKRAATKDTYRFKVFIWTIARIVKRHHGHLTLDRTKKHGTWIVALNGLRPLFDGLIPAALPVSTIEELQASSNKTPLRS
jgi:hypothetical protein